MRRKLVLVDAGGESYKAPPPDTVARLARPVLASAASARRDLGSRALLSSKLLGARFPLYRSQILQENTRWKALAEIYTMHSFAP